MPEIAAARAAQEYAGITVKAGPLDLVRPGPARRTIGGDVTRLPRAPERACDRRAAADETARAGERAGLVENMRRIGIVVIPPGEERPGTIDRRASSHEPGRTKFGLVGEHRRRPLGRRPEARDHDCEHDKDLADEQFGRGHVEAPAHTAGCGRGAASRLGYGPPEMNGAAGGWWVTEGDHSSATDSIFQLCSFDRAMTRVDDSALSLSLEVALTTTPHRR